MEMKVLETCWLTILKGGGEQVSIDISSKIISQYNPPPPISLLLAHACTLQARTSEAKTIVANQGLL